VSSRRAFLAGCGLLFAASAAVTIVWCASMPASCGMAMPGHARPGDAASFLGMWVVMMVAMMLPSLAPALWRYRQAVAGIGETRLGRLTVVAGAGYFFVWTVVGMVAFPLGVALAALEMPPALARAVIAAVVLIAGAVQVTPWKARQLAGCSACARAGGSASDVEAGTAWRHGVRLGLQCGRCCANLMAILLVVGVMDIRAMAVVTAAITAERLAPAGALVARGIGAAVIGAGVLAIARAALG
jgi:predicted metal-binding membrane protein